MTQHRQYSQPKSKHQENTKRSGVAADGPDRAEPTTGWPWGPPHPCVLGWQGRAPLCSQFFSVSFPASSFSGFLLFLPYNTDVSRPNSQRNTLHSHRLSFPGVLELVLERERGSGGTCEDSIPASIERFKNVFWLSFSFPAPLFSQSNFMFCNFTLIL